MIPLTRFGISSFCSFLLVLLFTISSVHGQRLPGVTAVDSIQSGMPKIEQFGIDGFRLMLQQRGLNAQPRFVGSALNKAPTKTVAIIIGDLRTVAQIRNQLNTFVLKGGSLLVASDLKSAGRQNPIPTSPILNTWVRDTPRMSASMSRQYGYRGYYDCPVVTKFDSDETSVLFDGVDSLVSNRPGEIQHGRGVKPVCWLPNRRPLMAMYNQGKGRMLFVADHSIFVNGMLVHGDNAKFVNNVTEWLCEDGERTTLVLIHDGQVLDNWKFGESLPPIPLSSLLRAAQRGGLSDLPIGQGFSFLNESLRRSQRENEFNNALQRTGTMLAGGRGRGVRFATLVVSGVVLLAFVVWFATTRSTPRRWLSHQNWNRT